MISEEIALVLIMLNRERELNGSDALIRLGLEAERVGWVKEFKKIIRTGPASKMRMEYKCSSWNLRTYLWKMYCNIEDTIEWWKEQENV